MIAPGRASVIASLLLLTAMGVFCAARLRVTNDVTRFLGAASEDELVRVSRRLAESDLNRMLVLTIRGESAEAAIAAASGMAERLRGHPEVARVESGPPEGVDEALRALYLPRALLFLSDRPEEELPARLSDEGLAEAVDALLAQLRLPSAALVKNLAPRDPLLAFWGVIRRLEATRAGGLGVRDGRYLTPDGEAALFVESRRSAFATAAQRRLQEAVDAAFAAEQQAAAAAGRGALRLERAGVAPIALASEASVRRDVSRISLLSTAGIVLLFLGLFRSARALALGLATLAAGVLSGLTANLLLFGEVHGITLAFGSALMGVCIDYTTHLVNHHALDPNAAAPGEAAGVVTLRRMWHGLLLGALTTAAGFAGLLTTSFPGIREIATFGVVGVLAALLATRFLVAPLLPQASRPPALHVRLAAAAGALLDALRARRRVLVALPLSALALCALGLPRLEFEDSPKRLYAEDPDLAAERDRVRARVSRADGARFVVALGPDAETALRRNDAAALRLEAAVAAGELGGFRSLHALLWSAELQAENAAGLAARADLAERLRAALAAAGFRPEAFAEGLGALSGPAPAPLTLEDVLATPLGGLAGRLVIEGEDGVMILTLLREVRDGAGLAARFADLEGVRYFDQERFLAGVWGSYRGQVLRLLAIGVLAMLAVVAARYRRPRDVFAAFTPALLGALTTVAALALLGESLHLLHLVALLLVLGTGADYGIFLVEAARRPAGAERGLGSTLLSIAIACATTCLAFALLALSEQPVLRAIGLTIGLGVSSSLVLAPTTLILTGAAPAAAEEPSPA